VTGRIVGAVLGEHGIVVAAPTALPAALAIVTGGIVGPVPAVYGPMATALVVVPGALGAAAAAAVVAGGVVGAVAGGPHIIRAPPAAVAIVAGWIVGALASALLDLRLVVGAPLGICVRAHQGRNGHHSE
jgi:hypothetical protein